MQKNNFLSINQYDVKNTDSKGLNARNNYWSGPENVYGIVDTTAELGGQVSRPIESDSKLSLATPAGRIVFDNGRLYILNGVGATDLFKTSISLSIGNEQVTIKPVSGTEFAVTSSSDGIDTQKLFNGTTRLSQSNGVTETSTSTSGGDSGTFNEGEGISVEINSSYSPDGTSKTVGDSLGEVTVTNTSTGESVITSDADTSSVSSSEEGGVPMIVLRLIQQVLK